MVPNLMTELFPNGLIACATCMGDAGSLINEAAGYAIVFMLVMLVIVLGSLIKFMSFLSKSDRAGGVGQPAPARVPKRPQ